MQEGTYTSRGRGRSPSFLWEMLPERPGSPLGSLNCARTGTRWPRVARSHRKKCGSGCRGGDGSPGEGARSFQTSRHSCVVGSGALGEQVCPRRGLCAAHE